MVHDVLQDFFFYSKFFALSAENRQIIYLLELLVKLVIINVIKIQMAPNTVTPISAETTGPAVVPFHLRHKFVTISRAAFDDNDSWVT